MHSRGPTKQYFYVWQPHRGYLHKGKKVSWYPPPPIEKGRWSHKYALYTKVWNLTLFY